MSSKQSSRGSKKKSPKKKNAPIVSGATASAAAAAAAKPSNDMADIMARMQMLELRLQEAEEARQEAEEARQVEKEARQLAEEARQANRTKAFQQCQLYFTDGLPEIKEQQGGRTKPSMTGSEIRLHTTEPVVVHQHPFGVWLPPECRQSNTESFLWKEKTLAGKLVYNNEAKMQSFVERVLQELAFILAQHPPMAYIGDKGAGIDVFREQTIFRYRPDIGLSRRPDNRHIGFCEVKCPDRTQTKGCSPNYTWPNIADDPILKANLDPSQSRDMRRTKRGNRSIGASAAASAAAATVSPQVHTTGECEQVTLQDPMRNEIVLRQGRDYIMYLRNEHGIRHAFCILTTFDYWRILWLPDEIQGQIEGQEQRRPESSMDAFARASNENTPSLQPFVQEATSMNGKRDFAKIKHNPPLKDRLGRIIIHASRVYRFDEPELSLVLLSVMYKMWLSPALPSQRLFQPSRQYIKMSRSHSSISWMPLPSNIKQLYWLRMPPPNTTNFFILKRLGDGLHGTAFLACSGSGCVCVLKFASIEMCEQRERERIQEEKEHQAKPTTARGASASASSASALAAATPRSAASFSFHAKDNHVFAQEAERWRELWGEVDIACDEGAKHTIRAATNAKSVWTTEMANRPCLVMPFVWTYRQAWGPPVLPSMFSSDVFYTPRHAQQQQARQGQQTTKRPNSRGDNNEDAVDIEEDEEGEEEEEVNEVEDVILAQNQNASTSVEVNMLQQTATRGANKRFYAQNQIGPGVVVTTKIIISNWGHQREEPMEGEVEQGQQQTEKQEQEEEDDEEEEDEAADVDNSNQSHPDDATAAMEEFDRRVTQEMISKAYQEQAAFACRSMLAKGWNHDDPKMIHVGLMPVEYEYTPKSKASSKAHQPPPRYGLTFSPILIDLSSMSKLTTAATAATTAAAAAAAPAPSKTPTKPTKKKGKTTTQTSAVNQAQTPEQIRAVLAHHLEIDAKSLM